MLFFVLLLVASGVMGQTEEPTKEQLGFDINYKDHMTYFKTYCMSKNIDYEVIDIREFSGEDDGIIYKVIELKNGVKYLYRLNPSETFSLMVIACKNEYLAEDALINLMSFTESLGDKYDEKNSYRKIANIVSEVNRGINEYQVKWDDTYLYKTYDETQNSPDYFYYWFPEYLGVSVQ